MCDFKLCDSVFGCNVSSQGNMFDDMFDDLTFL